MSAVPMCLQCDTSEDWHTGNEFLSKEQVITKCTISPQDLFQDHLFWKQAEVVNMKLSLLLLDHLLSKEKARPEFCKNK